MAAAAPATPSPPASGTVGMQDILTAVKNIVVALNNATKTYLEVNGTSNYAAISAPTVVKSSSGRLVNVSVVTAGSADGQIYDGAQLSQTSRPIFAIPDTLGLYEANLPMAHGILVVPGSGQIVSVSFS